MLIKLKNLFKYQRNLRVYYFEVSEIKFAKALSAILN